MNPSSAPSRLRVSHLDPSASAAFSLIEVVLAIGVVAFALVGIFGLFTSSLKTNKDSSAQQEGFEVARLIVSRMQDTNFLSINAMANLQLYLYQVNTPTNYYAYTSNGAAVLTNSASAYGLTNGTLYYVQLLRSTNINSATNVFPVARAGNPRGTDWTNWPALPMSVRVYQMPSTNMSLQTLTNSNVPVMTFDIVIPR